MGVASTKALLQTAISSITWAVPATAVAIQLASHTSFSRVDTQQFGDTIDTDQFPYARIHIPKPTSRRQSDGGDTGSLKRRDGVAHIFIYWACFASDWQGGGDYFDAIVDAVGRYFEQHGAPQPGPVPLGAEQVIAWGLSQEPRRELPDKVSDALHFRATVGITYIEYAQG